MGPYGPGPGPWRAGKVEEKCMFLFPNTFLSTIVVFYILVIFVASFHVFFRFLAEIRFSKIMKLPQKAGFGTKACSCGTKASSAFFLEGFALIRARAGPIWAQKIIFLPRTRLAPLMIRVRRSSSIYLPKWGKRSRRIGGSLMRLLTGTTPFSSTICWWTGVSFLFRISLYSFSSLCKSTS